MFFNVNLYQLLDMDPNDEAEEDGANVDLDAVRKGKCAVIKTSTRQVRIILIWMISRRMNFSQSLFNLCPWIIFRQSSCL